MQQNTSSNPPAEVRIIDDGDLRKYWTQLPNIIFMLGLTPFELTLYAYFKKVVGSSGGECWQKTATLAKATGMSGGMISKAKAGLTRPRAELNSQPLIVIEEKPTKHGGKPYHIIRLTDIWPENFAMFARPIPQDTRPISPHEIANSLCELAISPHEIKKNPPEEEPREETHTHTDAPRAPVAARVPAQSEPERVCVSNSKFSKNDLKRYARNQSHIQNPAGWASKAHRTGDWDDDVQDWFEREGLQSESLAGGAATDGTASGSARVAVIDSADCPDCHGVGFIYPDAKNLGAGVKRCEHPALRSRAA